MMFICLQKDAKQCCAATYFGCVKVLVVDRKVSTIELRNIVGFFSEINKHQNLMKLRHPWGNTARVRELEVFPFFAQYTFPGDQITADKNDLSASKSSDCW